MTFVTDDDNESVEELDIQRMILSDEELDSKTTKNVWPRLINTLTQDSVWDMSIIV